MEHCVMHQNEFSFEVLYAMIARIVVFLACCNIVWCIKINFILKYCIQWLQEYYFPHVGTFSDEPKPDGTLWDTSKWIFFWSLVCNDCKNTVFHMLEHCVMHQNKLIFVWSIVCNDQWLQEYCFPHVLTLSDESKRI